MVEHGAAHQGGDGHHRLALPCCNCGRGSRLPAAGNQWTWRPADAACMPRWSLWPFVAQDRGRTMGPARGPCPPWRRAQSSAPIAGFFSAQVDPQFFSRNSIGARRTFRRDHSGALLGRRAPRGSRSAKPATYPCPTRALAGGDSSRPQQPSYATRRTDAPACGRRAAFTAKRPP